MKGSNINFLLGIFIVGFGIAYILLNISNSGKGKNGYVDTKSIYDNKFSNVELLQNSYSFNYVKIPTYNRNTSHSWSAPLTINSTENANNESGITVGYALSIDNKSKNTINNSSVGYNTTNYLGGPLKSQNYSSQKNENNTKSNLSSGISQAINQFTALNNEKFVKIIQGSSVNVKTNHGFHTLNTDLLAINSSMSMTENSMQKTTNDVDPGGNEDMGDPIPVGDGWTFLFVLALGYGGLKSMKGLKSLKSLRV